MRKVIGAILLASLPLTGAAASDPDARIDYIRDVKPILSNNCYACHGPDAGKRKADLRLDIKEGAFAKLEKGYAIVPGDLKKSLLAGRITAADPDDLMPPAKSGKKLTPAQIDTLRKWIEQGAEWKAHWAFVPPAKTAPPIVKNVPWGRNDVDRFILARLEKEGLTPSPEADPVTLIRRLSFDLTGLPPTPAEVDAFVNDKAADALEKAADRLLASPAYGERMALYWLDLVRFADSRGYHSDNPRNVAAFRDYIIRAFNDNLPFDRFTVEQLAGDLLPNATLWQRVASGYNKLNQTTEEGGAQGREYEAKSVADRVRNVSSVWMGATMGCCECHDHKFDPFTTRDFYRMGAFFADIKEGSISDGDKGIPVPTAEQEAEAARLDAKAVELKKKADVSSPDLETAQAAWEKDALKSVAWVTLIPASIKSSGGATLLTQPDGSVLASGTNPAKDNYTVESKSDQKGVTAIRLEVLADGSFPGQGPGRAVNGNIVLTRFRIKSGGKDVPIAKATADHSQDAFPISSALDAKGSTGWALLPQTGKDHFAVFELKEPLAAGPLSVILEHQSVHGQHAIGKFRLSATTLANPGDAAPLPGLVKTALESPAEKRTDAQKKDLATYYRSISPLLKPLRTEIAAAEAAKAEVLKNTRKSLVSMPGDPRVVRILPRGNWLDSTGEVVTPAPPAFLPALEIGARRATRLDLANWLVDRRNPLPSRVFVNRLWKLFYGMGISKSLEDLGAQGEVPVNPELLDWLAMEFVDSKWDVKRMVRLLVTTAAYRQTSNVTPALRERDPFNRLIARQSRFRHDAETVRDNALAVGGILVRKIGGESVKPYQPKGYWFNLNFPKREWESDPGENGHRRGIYTWWQRTFHHPSMMAFDAPSREEACPERPRSNIPQQALALLNDPTYIEAARAFALRIVREGGRTPEERIAWAWREALSRKPAPDEVRVVAQLQKAHFEKYKADPKAAGELLAAPAPKDADAAELASWTSAARTILNLHETITRY